MSDDAAPLLATRLLDLLGTRFSVTAQPAELVVIDAFMDAYGEPLPAAPLNNSRVRHAFQMRLRRGPLGPPPQPAGPSRAVHRSKHSQWNFDCLPLGNGRHAWPDKQLQVTIDGYQIDILGAPALSAAELSEAGFHVCRSLALYLRPTGIMLHAASFCDAAGQVFAIAGHSGAGKTTCLLGVVSGSAATPHSNDRIFLDGDDPLHALSWPSYLSVCEGTLIDFVPLTRYAERYEDGLPETTYRWGHSLQRVYDKSRKRIFPMSAMVEAYGRHYRHAGRLAGILIVDLVIGQRDLLVLDRSGPCTASDIAQFEFKHEPSFMPWHGMPPPATRPCADLDGTVPVHRIRCGLDRLSALPSLVGAVL